MAEAPNLYAVFDPNSGEPVVIRETLCLSEEGAKIEAISHPDHTLYSGAQIHVVPPLEGSWEKMEKHGYRIRRVTVLPVD